MVLPLLILISSGKVQDLHGQIDTDEGTLHEILIHSPSLEGNFIGDSPDRWLSVYLPPGYEDDPQERYPVMYFLHSYDLDHTSFFGGDWKGGAVNIKSICDGLIRSGTIDPLIVVSPNNRNIFRGSYYRNSIVTGNWAGYNVHDVRKYMDYNFRTLPQKESYGVAGHSMGGHGTFWLIMNYPDVFNAAYSLSGDVSVEDLTLGSSLPYLIESMKLPSLEGADWLKVVGGAAAAVFAPDTSAPPPFYAQFPVTLDTVRIDSTWEKWLQQDILTMVPSFKESLLQLEAIQFDVGINDAFAGFINGNRKLSEAFTTAEIPHVFEEHEGDHSSKLVERLESKVFPFMNENLSDTMIADTTLYSLIEWHEFEIMENYILKAPIKIDISRWNSEKVSYEIIAGDPEGVFTIDNENNRLLADTLMIDFEKTSYHDLLLRASYQDEDNVLLDSANLLIWVENMNDNPPHASDTAFTIEDTSPKGSLVGKLEATDEDGNSLDFEIIDGNINETFYIHRSGNILIANTDSLAAESIAQFFLTIVISEMDGPFSDTALVTINIEKSTHSPDQNLELKITIYPNPADELITVECTDSEISSVKLHSLSGKLLFNRNLEGSCQQLDLSNYGKGIYILTVGTRDLLVTRKIIKL
jgi:enterochelin esterase-like enzyme